MAIQRESEIGGGTNARPLRETLAETGRGMPDEALGPGQRNFAEEAELADSPEGRRIEQKLRAEALARGREADEDAAVADPTGHA